MEIAEGIFETFPKMVGKPCVGLGLKSIKYSKICKTSIFIQFKVSAFYFGAVRMRYTLEDPAGGEARLVE